MRPKTSSSKLIILGNFNMPKLQWHDNGYCIIQGGKMVFSSLGTAFRRTLQKRPILTNTAVYASFYVAADLSQQTYKRLQSTNAADRPEYNLAATAKIAAVGSTVYAPALYYCYRFLDNKFPRTSVRHVFTKVACDQGFITPTLLATFFIVMAVVEGRDDLFEELKLKFWNAYIANQSFWIPAQTINFFLVPPYLRVVYVATASFFWINVLCYIKRQKLS